ncbi:LOW QUALITY PROTEIN: aromatic-L-amino-acid decarboxylase-like [Lingula anatina]|uniref:LOW QUALITY PROTEIN: aromatic-L-amino-acid decarboxylase-like n=1 Tax=Lingula anatina TaxID=7574 RepID=A0A1S3J2N9_LINAN|nr:LOW QUALITY PROTEIN: aromatic-L-amino-acid decarboxylase-like [Lingula anatina]|eukprot:XP_013404119.1 LOW QUALITY PROTEIN: aromatic-L-amino-acid decarboxylase-like [Lingula anatina]
MEANEFRKHGKEMVDYIADYLEKVHMRRVTPEVHPGYMRDLVPSKAPKKGEEWSDIMADVDNVVMPGITHWQHPNFHAYFPAGNSFPSILADMLSDAIGCVGFSWAASPACTELETIVLDWLGKMIGLPSVFLHENGVGGGVIQGSASECILVTLLAARHNAIKQMQDVHPFVEDGMLQAKLVAYCSTLAHSCVEKAGMIGCVKMRHLPTDENFSLRGQTLVKAIEEDRKLGLIPFYVCATLGTTAVCSFDNIKELGAACEREGVWLHIDAAYAGSALICPEFQHLIKGIEHAHSFNFNPNKWLLVNFDCSTMWVRNRDALTNALTVDPVYLRHHHSGQAIDFRHWGIPLSRRFRALKLWFVIRTYGVDGLQKYIREHVQLAKHFEGLVRADSRFEILGQVTMGLVCFRLKGPNKMTQNLLRNINHSGKLHMVPAKIHEKYVIRFAVCAQHAIDDDIEHAWHVITDFANDILENCDGNKGQEETENEENESDDNGDLIGSSSEDDEVFYEHPVPLVYPDKSDLTAQVRRNLLLKMVSDPKCYNVSVRAALSIAERRHKSDSAAKHGAGARFKLRLP